MFKVGDTIVCIEPKDSDPFLVLNKEYRVISCDNSYVNIDGKPYSYYTKRFILKKEVKMNNYYKMIINLGKDETYYVKNIKYFGHIIRVDKWIISNIERGDVSQDFAKLDIIKSIEEITEKEYLDQMNKVVALNKDYSAVINKETRIVKVGCQEFPFSKIEELYKAIQ